MVLTDGFHRVTLEYFEKPGHRDAKKGGKRHETFSDLRSEASSIRLSYLGPDTQDEMKAITLTESRFHTVMYFIGLTF